MNFSDKIQQAKGKRNLLQSQMKKTRALIEEKTDYLDTVEKAQAFIQSVAKRTQEQLKFHVEDVVQLAIDALFPDEYVFSMEFDIKHGRTSCSLVFKKNGYPVDILKAAGGGLVDIASLALRIAIWSIGRTDNVLILDEPVARIQPAELQAEAWAIIKELSKKLNLQFIIVSNSTNNGEAIHMVADKEFKVTKKLETIQGKQWKVSSVEGV